MHILCYKNKFGRSATLLGCFICVAVLGWWKNSGSLALCSPGSRCLKYSRVQCRDLAVFCINCFHPAIWRLSSKLREKLCVYFITNLLCNLTLLQQCECGASVIRQHWIYLLHWIGHGLVKETDFQVIISVEEWSTRIDFPLFFFCFK